MTITTSCRLTGSRTGRASPDRLLAHRFGGDLTFELMKTPRKGREDVYGALSLEAYLAEASRRAVKFRTLLEEREKP